MKARHSFSLLLALLPSLAFAAEPAVRITIRADQPGPPISSTMWGVFFEDINLGADGGLYAELVKNRSFEFPEALMGWSKLPSDQAPGSVAVLDETPFSQANPHYLRLVSSGSGAGAGVANEGFRGMGLQAGSRYRFSVYARHLGTESPVLRVRLVGADGKVRAETKLKGFKPGWSLATAKLTARATEPNAHLELSLEKAGTLDLDMVSLFPEETWKRRPNGLRRDLVQFLADLRPGFVRFPGGCIVEGINLQNRYQWKTTIGKLEERRLILNRWNREFKHRPAPDYYQSFGLGFFEFFQLCEDIGAEPLPILNCGMACQFNTGEVASLDQLDPFIQDALDLIEFANGPADSPWGAKRAAMGHPQPFRMKLLGIGNEQWGPGYIERYARFAQVLKSKHPEVRLISSAGPGPNDDKFHFAWPKLRELKADIVDEHCYARPDWFLDNSARYDHYDRSGPKIFMGEYAAQSVKTVSPDNRNTWECALAEAAYLIGLERNADVVVMASYAPLFAHVDGWQWTPNLIWMDNLRAYGTPSYYVQQLFSRHRGDFLLPTQVEGAPLFANQQPRFYASAVREQENGEVFLKVVNATASPITARLEIPGARQVRSKAKAIVLSSSQLEAVNSIEAPRNVAPRESVIANAGPRFEHTFPPFSLTGLGLMVK